MAAIYGEGVGPEDVLSGRVPPPKQVCSASALLVRCHCCSLLLSLIPGLDPSAKAGCVTVLLYCAHLQSCRTEWSMQRKGLQLLTWVTVDRARCIRRDLAFQGAALRRSVPNRRPRSFTTSCIESWTPSTCVQNSSICLSAAAALL